MKLAIAPVRALLVALLGALLAWTWFQGERVIPVVMAAVLVLASLGSQAIGDACLPAKPVAARWLLEGWILAQVVLAAVAAALVIIVTVELAAPKAATDETKQLLSALTTGITTFITAMLVGSADADATLGDRIKSRFRDHFKRYKTGQTPAARVYYLKEESEAERWLYSDNYGGISGWGWSARGKRASELAKRLNTDDVAARGG